MLKNLDVGSFWLYICSASRERIGLRAPPPTDKAKGRETSFFCIYSALSGIFVTGFACRLLVAFIPPLLLNFTHKTHLLLTHIGKGASCAVLGEVWVVVVENDTIGTRVVVESRRRRVSLSNTTGLQHRCRIAASPLIVIWMNLLFDLGSLLFLCIFLLF